jgi:pilus assembly protein CpaC
VSMMQRVMSVLLSVACFCSLPARAQNAAQPPAGAAESQDPGATQNSASSSAPGKLVVTVGKSLIIDSPLKIQRISVANGALMEAVAVTPKEVLINGKAPGETSLIIWQENGTRLLYDLTVRMSPTRLDAARQQLARDFPDDEINVTYENETAFVRGRVKDVMAADRVMAVATTLSPKTVNLLQVDVPPVETQILLKVRFANVDRGISTDLGFNIATGAFNQSTSIGTGQYGGASIDTGGTISLSDALNVFLFRKDLNLGATIKALESKRLLETLAEPNLLAMNGRPASFITGGEFPFPMVQGGGSTSAVSIMFKEFGIKINFLPVITPRGTIQMQVSPEVSALDYSNAVTFQGYTIPAISTRRVQTSVELESGQSFVIAGLMDNSMTETLNKIPGLASIPLLGKLFQSRAQSRSNTELLVIVTPEIVRPIPADRPVPSITMTQPFMKPNSPIPMSQPGMDKTGPVPVKPPQDTIPLEQLILQQQKQGQAAPPPTVPQFVIVPAAPAQPVNPGLTPAAPVVPGGSGN